MNGRQFRSIFKQCISQACDCTGTPHRHFRENRGLDSFEIDTDFASLSPRDVAVAALEELCTRDSGDRYDAVIFLAIIEFLDLTIGPPKEDQTRFTRVRRLKEIGQAGGTTEDYRGWVDLWYGNPT